MVVFNKLDASKRVKQLIVTKAVLAEMFKFDGSHIPVFHGIPKNAEIVGMDIDQRFPALVLYYEHPSFPIIGDGLFITQTITMQSGTVQPCDECLTHVIGLRNMFNED